MIKVNALNNCKLLSDGNVMNSVHFDAILQIFCLTRTKFSIYNLNLICTTNIVFNFDLKMIKFHSQHQSNQKKKNTSDNDKLEYLLHERQTTNVIHSAF